MVYRRPVIRARLLRDEALTVESTVEAIRRGQQYDVQRLFDARGKLRPITELSEEEAWCIAGFEVIIKNAEAGDGHQDTVHKVKLVDRVTRDGRFLINTVLDDATATPITLIQNWTPPTK